MRLPRIAAPLALLAASALAAACHSDLLDGTKTSTTSFGPESLVVLISLASDTVRPGSAYRATAVAHNETLHPILATLQCPVVGLTVRVVDANGQVVTSTNGGCTAGEPSRNVTIQPDDSVVTTLTGSTVTTGAFRVQAAYEAANGRSVVVERTLVVR